VIRRLTGCDPPRHAVVSGTLRLPVERSHPGFAADDPAARLAAARRELRDVEFHPERHLVPLHEQPEVVRDLVTEKRRWIDTHPTPALARRRCHAIRAANAELGVHTAGSRRALAATLEPLATAVRARAVLEARDYPWCFFPEKTLKTFLLLETP
jgi:hypothetical protein